MTKQRWFEILESTDRPDQISRKFNAFIFALILLNVLAVAIETIEPVREQYETFFQGFELFSVVVFLIEYLSRLWVADLKPQFQTTRYPRLAYAFTPLAIVDLLAILPFFLTGLTIELRLLRVFRLFRLVRVMKIDRYSNAIRTLGAVFKSRKEELIVSLSIVLVVLLLASSLMYVVESEAQPEAFANIPEAMWWGATMLTTTGYGDVYPVTSLGKFLGAIISIFCLGVFALPAGIIAGGFAEEIRKRQAKALCPRCGRELKS
ncbi:MAG: ion transporter [Deinococcota bacterium]|nr:ion transporter [Deinococcota bacterium]